MVVTPAGPVPTITSPGSGFTQRGKSSLDAAMADLVVMGNMSFSSAGRLLSLREMLTALYTAVVEDDKDLGRKAVASASSRMASGALSIVQSLLSSAKSPIFFYHDGATIGGKHLVVSMIGSPAIGDDPLFVGVLEAGGSAEEMRVAMQSMLSRVSDKGFVDVCCGISDGAPAATKASRLVMADCGVPVDSQYRPTCLAHGIGRAFCLIFDQEQGSGG